MFFLLISVYAIAHKPPSPDSTPYRGNILYGTPYLEPKEDGTT